MESYISRFAIEEYCKMQFSDRYHYQQFPEVEKDLLKQMRKAKRADMDLEILLRTMNCNIQDREGIEVAADDSWGYLIRKKDDKKLLLSMFNIRNLDCQKAKDR